jgi:hypothetical protein
LDTGEEPALDFFHEFVEGIDTAAGTAGDFLDVPSVLVAVFEECARGGGKFLQAIEKGFAAEVDVGGADLILLGDVFEGFVAEDKTSSLEVFSEGEDAEIDEAAGPGEEGASEIVLVERLPHGDGGFLHDVACVLRVEEEREGIIEEGSFVRQKEADELLAFFIFDDRRFQDMTTIKEQRD